MKALRVWRLALLFPIALMGLSATACDNPGLPIALTLDESGSVVILYNRCKPDRLVRSVALYSVSLKEGTYSVESTVWEIKSPAGSHASRFVVGETPDGFETTQELEEDVRQLLLMVEINGIGLGYFKVAALSPERVLIQGGAGATRSRDEFWAMDTCEG